MRVLLTLAALALAFPAQAEKKLTTDTEKTLYALGLEMAKGLAAFDLTEKELAIVLRAVREANAGTADSSLAEHAAGLADLAKERQQGIAKKNRETAKKVMAKAAQEKGAKKTESGLVVVPLKAGAGEKPTEADTVKVHYTGTLPDGSKFDSSLDRGQPATFPLARVVPCWREGLTHIAPGGKAVLYCPPDLAYGDSGPPEIGPGQALRFEVELLEVQKAQ